jgi:hypothetical protein
MTGTDQSIEVPWQWHWVPTPGGDPAADTEWLTATAAVFDRWLTGHGQPPTTAENDAGAGATAVAGGASSYLARELRRRAGDLPAGARLVWGAAFDAAGPRWWPVQVVLERVGDATGDSDYLLDLVGARSLVDGLAPNISYTSTSFGDGLRVIRPERGPDGRVNALVRAAIRIEWPALAGNPATRSDFLLTTRIWDMSLLAVVGPGLDGLMRQMAGAVTHNPVPASPEDRPTELVDSR